MTLLEQVAPCLCGCIWLQHNKDGCRCGRCLSFRLDTQIWPIGLVVVS